MSCLWKQFQDIFVHKNNIRKKSIEFLLVASWRFQHFRPLLQNSKLKSHSKYLVRNPFEAELYNKKERHEKVCHDRNQ